MVGRSLAVVLCLFFVPPTSGAITPNILEAMTARHGAPVAPNSADIGRECRLEMAPRTGVQAHEKDPGSDPNVLLEVYSDCKSRNKIFCQTFVFDDSTRDFGFKGSVQVSARHFDCFPRNCSESDVANYAGILYPANDSIDSDKILAASHCDNTVGRPNVGFYLTAILLCFLGMLMIVGSIFDGCVNVEFPGDGDFEKTGGGVGSRNTKKEKENSQKNNNRNVVPIIMVTRPSDSSISTVRDSLGSICAIETPGPKRRLPPLAASSTSSETCSGVSAPTEEPIVHPALSNFPKRRKTSSSFYAQSGFPVLCGRSRSFTDVSFVSVSSGSAYETLNFSDPSVFVSPLETESANLIQETSKTPEKIQATKQDEYHCTVTPCNMGRRPIEALLSSSAMHAVNQIFVSEDLEGNSFAYLHAMQTVAFWWIILYQTAMYVGTSELLDNPKDFESSLPIKTFQIISNSFLHFHTVFFAGAILDAQSTAKMLENAHTFWNVTLILVRLVGKKCFRQFPSYIISILIWSFFTPNLNSGPVWNAVRYSECGSLWWTNVLYISNFYPISSLSRCMPWTWYISCEMQVYIVGLVLTALLTKHRNLGVIAAVGTVLFTTLLNVYIAYDENLNASPVMEFYAQKNNNTTVEDGNSSSVFDVLLSKPQFYWASYAIGLIVGVCLIRRRRIRRSVEITLGILSTACGLSLVIVIVSGAHFFKLTTLEDGPLILNLIPKAWVLLLIPVVVYCRYATVRGPVTRLFSAPCWNTIGRLNFSVFVVNPVILGYVLFGIDSGLHFSTLNLILYFLSTLVLTYLAVVLTFVVGSNPLRQVLRLVFFCIHPKLNKYPETAIDVHPEKNLRKKLKRSHVAKRSRRRSSIRSALLSQERRRSFEYVFTPVLRTKFASPF